MHLSRLTSLLNLCALMAVLPTASAESLMTSFCSKLDFNGVTWSPTVPVRHREAFSLALNISGSFEGKEGWSNLANNFDGMGFSLGLLNQNLGMGTLQPLFIEMKSKNERVLASVFSPPNFISFVEMLNNWEKTPASQDEPIISFLRDHGFSELDEPELVAPELNLDPAELSLGVENFLIDRNKESVAWAKANVLAGKQIKDDWKTQLKAASDTAEYRSIQVVEAEDLHHKAMELFGYFKMTQLRSYLFFFDIIVQNGGLSDAVKTKYNTYVRKNPKATETARLKKILQLRLPYVRRKYRGDVQRRKLSIINGTGRVHGFPRNYNAEYCTNLRAALP